MHLSDELVSEAYLFITGLVLKFDPNRNVRFTTFMYVSLERFMWRFIKRMRTTVSSCEPLTEELVPSFTNAEGNTQEDWIRLLENIGKGMSKRDFSYFVSVFLEGKTLREIGTAEGVAAETIRLRMSKAKKEIRINRKLCQEGKEFLRRNRRCAI